MSLTFQALWILEACLLILKYFLFIYNFDKSFINEYNLQILFMNIIHEQFIISVHEH